MINKVFLGDICDIQGGYAFKSKDFAKNGIPLLKIANIKSNNTIDFEGKTDFISWDDFEKYKNFEVVKGDILVALSGATTGKYGIYNSDEKVLLNQRVARVRAKESKVTSEYIYYYMNLLESEISRKAQGAAQPNISTSSLEKMSIPLPSIEKQIEIVNTVKIAGDLILKRQFQIKALDELTQSLFLEMFEKQDCEVAEIGNVISKITTGKSLVGEVPTKFKVINTSAVSYQEFDSNKAKYLPADYIPPEEHLVKKGDVLVSRMNTSELVGAAAYVFDEVENLALPDRIWKLHVDLSKVNSIYLWYAINQLKFRDSVTRVASGTSGSMKNISQKVYQKLIINLPDLELQNQFSDKLLIIREQKKLLIKSKQQFETLYNSLLQKAFKGELFQD